MHVEHINPDGSDDLENLCLACRQRNEFKGATTRAVEPLTGEPTPFYHPPQHQWTRP